MEISVIGKGVKISNTLDLHIQSKVCKLQRFYDRLMNCQVKIEKTSLKYRTDVMAHIPGRILKVTHEDESEEVAIGLAIDKMERLLKKTKKKQYQARIPQAEKRQEWFSTTDDE